MTEYLNRLTGQEQKKEASEAIFDQLSDYLFDKVILLTWPTLATSTAITSTTNYGVLLRTPDTSAGKYIRPDKTSRFRCVFYISNPVQADAYILSPAVHQSSTAPQLPSDMASYVGIRILGGVVSMVSRSSAGEVSKETTFRILTNDSYTLEIKYNITYADIFIDNQQIGSIECNMEENIYRLVTVYPLIAPIRSLNASSVSINVENYQFLQSR